MEKHYFTLRDSMTMTERKVADELEDWVKSLTESESGELISALEISKNV